MVGELKLVVVAVRLGPVEAVIVVVGVGRPVVLADVPVELDRVFLVFDRQGLDEVARRIAVKLLGNGVDFVQLVLGNALHQATRSGRAIRHAVEQVGAFKLFIGQEEEQPVLEDRAAKGEAVTLFVEVARVDGLTFEFVALQAVSFEPDLVTALMLQAVNWP
jgi:hypothetical protein